MRELTTICIQFMKLYPIDSKKTLEGSFIDIDEHFFGMVEDENEQHKTDSLYDEDVEIPSTQEAERLEIQKQKDKQNAFNARIELIENALSHMPPTDYIEDLIMLNAESTIIEMVQVMHKSPMTIVQYQNIRNDYFEYIRNNERYQSKMILNFLRFKYVDMIPVTKLLRASENRYNKMRAQYQQFMSSKTSKELVEQDISYLQYLGLSWLDLAMMAEWRYGFLACYDTSRDLVIVDTLMQDIATTTTTIKQKPRRIGQLINKIVCAKGSCTYTALYCTCKPNSQTTLNIVHWLCIMLSTYTYNVQRTYMHRIAFYNFRTKEKQCKMIEHKER